MVAILFRPQRVDGTRSVMKGDAESNKDIQTEKSKSNFKCTVTAVVSYVLAPRDVRA